MAFAKQIRLAILPLLVVSGSTARAQNDQVFPRRGVPISGQIVSFTKTTLTIKAQGSNRNVSVNDIRRVNFKEDPPNLQTGRSKAVTGRYDAALADLKLVDYAAIERAEVKADLVFYRAYCEGRLSLSSGGDKKKAIADMLNFVRKASNSFHFYEAAELLGDLSVGTADYASASKYFGAIAAAPWPSVAMKGKLRQAQAFVHQNDFNKAKQFYESVIASESDTPEAKRQKLIAQVGKGRCLAELESAEAGLAVIEKVIAENDPSDGELFGKAYNAQGACLLKSGKTKEAVMAFLHVDILFYADPETHAESLHHLGKLWDAIKNPDRAIAARNRLTDLYAGSIWANRP